MTQLEIARSGVLSDELRHVAHEEKRDPEELRRGVAAGRGAGEVHVLCGKPHEAFGLPVSGVRAGPAPAPGRPA